MIYGVQKLSLVDYPGKPSFVVFLGGCNFRCPFCYNKGIVDCSYPKLDENDILNQIKEREHFVDAVVVTGGEATLYQDQLIAFLEKLRKFDLKIKLDTNGTHPEVIKQILEKQLIDYIAMDIKGTYAKYEQICGTKVVVQHLKESIYLIEHSGIDYEFRTTVNKTMHNSHDIEEISTYMVDKTHYYLQGYQYQENQIKNHDFGTFSDQELLDLKACLGCQTKVSVI